MKRIAYIAIPILILASLGMLPVSLAMGQAGGGTTAAVTVTATPVFVSEPGGGGGGGRVRPSPTEPLPPESLVTAAGMLTQRVIIYSEDGVVELLFREGTIGLTAAGEPLSEAAVGKIGEVYIVKVEDPPPPPLGAEFIGPVYDVGPTGTIFRPQISLSFTYNEDLLPEGVAEENLILASWDEADEQWKLLEVFIVAPEINIITTRIDHLSLFAILAYARPADFATFAASSLLVMPTEVDTGERVNIVIAVSNTGGQSGSYEVVLKINGLLEASQEITIAAGDSEFVSFDIVKNTAGTYSLEVAGFTGSFTVREKPAEEPPTVTPLPSIVTAAPPPNWPIIGGIIAAVMLAAAAMIYSFLINRRYRYAAVTYPVEVERPIAPPTVAPPVTLPTAAPPAPEPVAYPPPAVSIGEVIGRIVGVVGGAVVGGAGLLVSILRAIGRVMLASARAAAGGTRFLVGKAAVAIAAWVRFLSKRK